MSIAHQRSGAVVIALGDGADLGIVAVAECSRRSHSLNYISVFTALHKIHPCAPKLVDTITNDNSPFSMLDIFS